MWDVHVITDDLEASHVGCTCQNTTASFWWHLVNESYNNNDDDKLGNVDSTVIMVQTLQ